MEKRAGPGDRIAWLFIGLTALCLLCTPVFSPAIVLGALVGIAGSLLAFALGARRLAVVGGVFGLAPLAGLIFFEFVVPSVANGYLVFGPVAAVILLAVLSGWLLRRDEGVEVV